MTRIEFLPTRAPHHVNEADPNTAVLVVKNYDLSNEDGWQQLTNCFLGDTPAGRAAAAPRQRERALPGYRTPVATAKSHVGRNDPCPCGSGKKFKKCCMRERADNLANERASHAV